MKKIILACGIAAITMASSACSGSSNAAPENFADSISYYTGQDMGLYCLNTIANMPEDVKAKFDKDQFIKGMEAALSGDTAKMGYLEGLQMGMNLMRNVQMLTQNGINTNPEEMLTQIKAVMSKDSIPETEADSIRKTATEINGRVNAYLMKVEHERKAAELQAREQLGRENEAAGKAYIEKVKADDKDVKTTESGLSYKVNQQGTGVLPGDNDKVKVIYTGRLIDGTEFDSSKGQAVEFPVSGVVPGFKEGLKMMNKGSKYTLYIPGNLAYGFQAPEKIGPNSTLVFDVEVTEVIPAKK